MRATLINFCFIFGLAAPALAANGDDETCTTWFRGTGISSFSPSCLSDCSIAPVNMGTFVCHNGCDEFCKKSEPACKLSEYWNGRLKGPTEPFKMLAESEKSKVSIALSRLPKGWQPKSLKAIVRASRPVDITSILSPASSSHEYVILFARAFGLPQEDLDRVIAHEVVHLLIPNEWRNHFSKYKTEHGWKQSASSGQADGARPGDFVDPDGKLSPEEDFANNIEFYLFEPDTLKSKNPKIFTWMQSQMGKALKLEKGCR